MFYHCCIFSVYSLDGVLALALLVVCTCAYITKVPRLKSFFLSEKKGFFGVFYKGNDDVFLSTLLQGSEASSLPASKFLIWTAGLSKSGISHAKSNQQTSVFLFTIP